MQRGTAVAQAGNRVTWVDYFLGIADSVAVRADCTRRRVGAVVVDASTKHIISTGYNGAAPGEPGCLSDGACPRGQHYRSLYHHGGPADNGRLPALFGSTCGGCGEDWPCPEAASPGSSYDTGKQSCIAIHAEANALLRAGQQASGNWLFCTDEPCDGCMRLIKGAGIHLCVWYGGAWSYNGKHLAPPVPQNVSWFNALRARLLR